MDVYNQMEWIKRAMTKYADEDSEHKDEILDAMEETLEDLEVFRGYVREGGDID